MGCGASAKKYEQAPAGKGTDDAAPPTVIVTDTAKQAVATDSPPKPVALSEAAQASLEKTRVQVKEAFESGIKDEKLQKQMGLPVRKAEEEEKKEEGKKEEVKKEEVKKEEEEEDDDQDEMDEKEAEEMFKRGSMLMEKNRGKKREGVMAENTAPEEGWEPPKIEKTEEQNERLKNAISRPQAFMFHALEPTEKETLLAAFKEHQLEAGTEVIKQGQRVMADDPGLYVIESGDLDVFKTKDPEADFPGPNVFTYKGQGQFGELALLYNAPRAATVIAKTAAVVWSIDRNTFNHCVKDATVRRSQKYEEFLGKVEILESLAPEERSKIADVLKSKTVNEGDQIIVQGESGDDFFIIEEGSAVATKDGNVVKEYGATDYFGELALISTAERRATVTAKVSPTKILSVDRAAFTRLLGSLEEKLKEKAKKYVGMEDEVL